MRPLQNLETNTCIAENHGGPGKSPEPDMTLSARRLEEVIGTRGSSLSWRNSRLIRAMAAGIVSIFWVCLNIVVARNLLHAGIIIVRRSLVTAQGVSR